MEKNKHIIICVGRQLGSGGHDIARMLALDFNAKYYDNAYGELWYENGVEKSLFFEQNDERRGIFRSLFHLHASHVSDNNLYNNDFSQENLFKFQSDAILKAADESSCVFVGRCADYILRDDRDAVNIFISAPLEYRIEQMMSRQDVSREEARRMIEQEEGRRAQYYNYYTGKKWGAAESYDLCIDSTVLGLAETEKMIAAFIRKRWEI